MGGDVPTSRLGVTRWNLQREVERKRGGRPPLGRGLGLPESPRSNETHNGEPPTNRQSALSNGQGQSFKQRSLYPHWYWVAPGHPPIGPRASRPSNGVQHSLGRLWLFARGRNRESLLSTIRKPKEHQSFQLPGPEANHIVRANALARTRSVVRAQMMCCAEAVQQSTQGFSPPRTLSSASCNAGSIHSLGFAPTRWPTCLLKRVA